MNMKPLFFFAFSIVSPSVFSHGGIDHKKAVIIHTPEKQEQILLTSIGEDYLKTVGPIFKGKCFDCHSNQTNFPWYYQVPGIHSLMNSHIEEARSHLDMSKGYPFISHVKPIEDLKAIQKSIEEEKMPPLYYKALHSGSALTTEEKLKVKEWIEASLKKLKNVSP